MDASNDDGMAAVAAATAIAAAAEKAAGAPVTLRFLLYGHAGWIGGQLAALIAAQGDVCVAAEARADNIAAVRDELRRVRPDRVLCCIGRTHGPGNPTIDWLEADPTDAEATRARLRRNVADNLYAPVVLALLCRERGMHLTYVGTGCCYSSDAEHPIGAGRGFREDETPNFHGSSYSIVKGYTDRLMALLGNNGGGVAYGPSDGGACGGAGVLCARIRMPIVGDGSPRDFVQKLLGYAATGRICSIPNSMSVLPTLLPALLSMARRRVSGAVNLCNPGVIDHDTLLAMYRDLVDPALRWRNFSLEEQALVLKAGRSNNEMCPRRLLALCPDVPPVHEAVRGVLLAMRARRDPPETSPAQPRS